MELMLNYSAFFDSLSETRTAKMPPDLCSYCVIVRVKLAPATAHFLSRLPRSLHAEELSAVQLVFYTFQMSLVMMRAMLYMFHRQLLKWFAVAESSADEQKTLFEQLKRVCF